MKELFIVIMILIILIAGIAFVINLWDKSQLRIACGVFSQESDRETKFVEYTYWQRDCLTPQENGKWISVFNLRGE